MPKDPNADIYAMITVGDVRRAVLAIHQKYPDVHAGDIVTTVLDSLRRSQQTTQTLEALWPSCFQRPQPSSFHRWRKKLA
jgi:hypothetical protein